MDSVYQVETENHPFDGVSADPKDGEHAVWIAFGSTTADQFAHGINRVTAIRMLPAGGDTGVVLAVDAADGSRTILELATPDALCAAGRNSLPALAALDQGVMVRVGARD
jgi:hypothetical protein